MKPAFILRRLNQIHGGYKMISLGNLLKRTIGIGVFGAALIFAASITANAQYRDDEQILNCQLLITKLLFQNMFVFSLS